ncbi:pleckstrin homology domain-containing family N member 1 [Trematomus bernacchii]|uniref:PH domain-containing protein n=1 Tax=Pagothenia borchgrevinki TaxID=8213 RepID=A0ABD2HBP2_PAGBO|nr:pleckstrin homology domain-containing family N member 1 [Trematomus bernacchii]
MGCCSVTQRNTGVDEVGPDEIELLELSGDNLGLWSLGETRLQLSVRNSREEQQPPPLKLPPPPPPPRYPSTRHLEKEVVLWGRSREELTHRIHSSQPIREWEGQPAHMYGEIIHSSLVSLYNSYTQETSEHFLVLFSFHLLILSLDHSRQDFSYEGILPLSGLSLEAVSLDHDASHSPHMFEISGPMVDSKVFICASAAEQQKWMQHIEDRRHKSMAQPMSPSHCALSYLLPCDEHWKREELKKYLLQAPIWQWEGSSIQHMGQPGYISIVHIINSQRQGLQERLMVLFPQDVLLLSVDNKRLNIRYEGRLPRQSIRAVERSALPGRLEFELIGELVEPLQVSCTCYEDYRNWMFQLQQPDRNSHVAASHAPPPIMPKLQRSRKESQEPMITADQRHINGRS